MSLPTANESKSLLDYHRFLSPSASIKVSPVYLETMNFGEVWKDLMGECSKETSFSILDHFYQSSGNFIDTANMYMAGESEVWLGEWMATRGVRDQLVVATKYSNPLKTPMMEPEDSILSNYGGNNKKSLRLSLETSLEKFHTEYVEILYVHAWEGTTSMPELMRALDDVVRAGKVLYLGMSNWPARVVVKANEYARAHAIHRVRGSMECGRKGNRTRGSANMQSRRHGHHRLECAWRGKFKSASQRKEAAGRAYSTAHLGTAPDEAFEKVSVTLEKVAARKKTSSTSVALRYVMLKAPYVFPICGGRGIDHLQSNIDALSIDLSQKDMQEIESAVPFDLGYPHSLLSGARDKQISAKDPAFVVQM